MSIEIKPWIIWTGSLNVGSRCVETVSIMSNSYQFLPSLGGSLTVSSCVTLDTLWCKILPEKPTKLDLKIPVMVDHRTVSVFPLSSRNITFKLIVDELSINNNSKVVHMLCGSFLNLGMVVEFFLIPDCKEMQDLGISIPSSIDDPSLFVLFVIDRPPADYFQLLFTLRELCSNSDAAVVKKEMASFFSHNVPGAKLNIDNGAGTNGASTTLENISSDSEMDLVNKLGIASFLPPKFDENFELDDNVSGELLDTISKMDSLSESSPLCDVLQPFCSSNIPSVKDILTPTNSKLNSTGDLPYTNCKSLKKRTAPMLNAETKKSLNVRMRKNLNNEIKSPFGRFLKLYKSKNVKGKSKVDKKKKQKIEKKCDCHPPMVPYSTSCSKPKKTKFKYIPKKEKKIMRKLIVKLIDIRRMPIWQKKKLFQKGGVSFTKSYKHLSNDLKASKQNSGPNAGLRPLSSSLQKKLPKLAIEPLKDIQNPKIPVEINARKAVKCSTKITNKLSQIHVLDKCVSKVYKPDPVIISQSVVPSEINSKEVSKIEKNSFSMNESIEMEKCDNFVQHSISDSSNNASLLGSSQTLGAILTTKTNESLFPSLCNSKKDITLNMSIEGEFRYPTTHSSYNLTENDSIFSTGDDVFEKDESIMESGLLGVSLFEKYDTSISNLIILMTKLSLYNPTNEEVILNIPLKDDVTSSGSDIDISNYRKCIDLVTEDTELPMIKIEENTIENSIDHSVQFEFLTEQESEITSTSESLTGTEERPFPHCIDNNKAHILNTNEIDSSSKDYNKIVSDMNQKIVSFLNNVKNINTSVSDGIKHLACNFRKTRKPKDFAELKICNERETMEKFIFNEIVSLQKTRKLKSGFSFTSLTKDYDTKYLSVAEEKDLKYVHIFSADFKLKFGKKIRKNDLLRNGGHLLVLESKIDQLLDDKAYSLCLQKNRVKCCAYMTSKPSAANNKIRNILHLGSLLLLHKTAMLDERLISLLKSLFAENESSRMNNVILVQKNTLIQCYESICHRSCREDKEQRILVRNLELVKSFMLSNLPEKKKFVALIFDKGNSNSIHDLINILRTFHKKLGFSYKNVALLVGSSLRGRCNADNFYKVLLMENFNKVFR